MDPTHTTEPAPASEDNQLELQESMDLCFMLDCTGSMQSYINMARNRVQEIIAKVQEEYPKSEIRIGIVAYRDVQDSNRFEIFPFETSAEKAKQFLAQLQANGGGDTPEDINGAFQKTLFLMEWKNPVRLLVHIADAPCHGKEFHSADDNHPNGYIEDMGWDLIFKELVEKRLDYLFIKISQITDTMFEKFRAFAEKQGSLEAELSFQQEQIPNMPSSTSYPSSGLFGGMPAMPTPTHSSSELFGGMPGMPGMPGMLAPVGSPPGPFGMSKSGMPPSSSGLFGGTSGMFGMSMSGIPVPTNSSWGVGGKSAPTHSSSGLFGGGGPAPTASPSGLFSAGSKDDELRMASEACFVENVTKNLKAGVLKQQQQTLAKKSAPK